MIIIVIGGIGSGKSVSIIKELVDRKEKSFVNFSCFKLKHTKRLKRGMLFTKNEQKKDIVNFDFWKNEINSGGFDIYLDEFHNVMNSRRSMSKQNVLMSNWLSQIRKIMGNSEKHNLYVISQKPRRIDVNSRELAHIVIYCRKLIHPFSIPTIVRENGRIRKRNLPVVEIFKYYFRSLEELDHWKMTGKKCMIKTTHFIANSYYKYYDSYELIDFGNEEYL